MRFLDFFLIKQKIEILYFHHHLTDLFVVLCLITKAWFVKTFFLSFKLACSEFYHRIPLIILSLHYIFFKKQYFKSNINSLSVKNKKKSWIVGLFWKNNVFKFFFHLFFMHDSFIYFYRLIFVFFFSICTTRKIKKCKKLIHELFISCDCMQAEKQSQSAGDIVDIDASSLRIVNE